MPPNYGRRGETLPTYLMSAALECQRGDGPVHLAAPEQRAGYHSRAVQEREGLTFASCTSCGQGRPLLLPQN